MKIESFKKENRLSSKIDWLDANFYFSFANQYDPKRIRFGALLVVNDDIISANRGFGSHSHNDMEIITIPMNGILSHKDSTGGEGEISEGEVQVMTAGTGITHSEHNDQDVSANTFQIWIHPALQNLIPSYNQKDFSDKITINKINLLVSADGREDSLAINQDAFISKIILQKYSEIKYTLFSDFKFNKSISSGLFVTCLSGEVRVKADSQEFLLQEKDWLEIQDFNDVKNYVTFETDSSESRLLIIQVPML